MKKYLTSLLLIGSFFLLGACGNNNHPTDSKNAEIITTFYPMYYFAKEIVGDTHQVDMLIPAGTEPHDYEPTVKDMMKINEGKAFIYNSNYLETWVKSSQESFGSKVTVIEAGKNLASDGDPHFWLDPLLAKKQVAVMTKNLISVFPQEEKQLQKNSNQLQEKLTQLHESYQQALANPKQKMFLTQHQAFGHLAKRYHLTEKSITGVEPTEEPSPKKMAELKEWAKKEHLTGLYFEENASNKVATVLQKETGLKSYTLDTLESVSKAKIDKGEDYFTIMEQNLKNLKATLQ